MAAAATTDIIMAKVAAMNILIILFVVNVCLLVIGVVISWVDIHLLGSGLYLALVSIVTLVIVLAFCLVGPDEHHEPVAKQMWSKSRQTIRRYTVRHPRLITNPLKPQSPCPAPPPPPDTETSNENCDVEANGTIMVRIHLNEPEPGTKSDEKSNSEKQSDIESSAQSSDPVNEDSSEMILSDCRMQFLDAEEPAVFL